MVLVANITSIQLGKQKTLGVFFRLSGIPFWYKKKHGHLYSCQQTLFLECIEIQRISVSGRKLLEFAWGVPCMNCKRARDEIRPQESSQNRLCSELGGGGQRPLLSLLFQEDKDTLGSAIAIVSCSRPTFLQVDENISQDWGLARATWGSSHLSMCGYRDHPCLKRVGF